MRRERLIGMLILMGAALLGTPAKAQESPKAAGDAKKDDPTDSSEVPAWPALRWGDAETEVMARLSGRFTRKEKSQEAMSQGTANTAPKSSLEVQWGPGDRVTLSFDDSGHLRTAAYAPKANSFRVLQEIDKGFTEEYGPPKTKEDSSVSNKRLWAVAGGVVEVSRIAVGGGFMLVVMKPSEDGAANAVTVSALLDSLFAAIGRSRTEVHRSAEGFQETRWGMSVEDVKTLFPLARPALKDGLGLEGETAGKESLTAFMFAGGRLSTVGVMFPKKFVNANGYLDEYAELKGLLTEKYGKPADDSTDWRNRLYADDKSHWGTAVSVGHLRLTTQWETPLTRITLRCSGENFKVVLMIRYESKEFAPAAEAESRKGKLNQL